MADVPHPTEGWLSVIPLTGDERTPSIEEVFRAHQITRDVAILEVDVGAFQQMVEDAHKIGLAVGVVKEAGPGVTFEPGAKVWYPDERAVPLGDFVWTLASNVIAYLDAEE